MQNEILWAIKHIKETSKEKVTLQQKYNHLLRKARSKYPQMSLTVIEPMVNNGVIQWQGEKVKQ